MPTEYILTSLENFTAPGPDRPTCDTSSAGRKKYKKIPNEITLNFGLCRTQWSPSYINQLMFFERFSLMLAKTLHEFFFFLTASKAAHMWTSQNDIFYDDLSLFFLLGRYLFIIFFSC